LLVAWPFAAFELVDAGRLTAWGAAAAFVPLAIAISLLVKTVVIVHSRLLANYLERDRPRTIRLRSLQADFGPPWVKKLLADNTTGAARSGRVRVSV